MTTYNFAQSASKSSAQASQFDCQIPFTNPSHVEFQILPDGKSRFYAKDSQDLDAFLEKLPEITGKSDILYSSELIQYARTYAVVINLTPAQILLVAPYVSDSNWQRAVKRTDTALESTTDKNFKPVSQKVFRQRIEKQFADVDAEYDLMKLQAEASFQERIAKKEVLSSGKSLPIKKSHYVQSQALVKDPSLDSAGVQEGEMTAYCKHDDIYISYAQ